MNSFKECIHCPAYCKTCKFNNNGDLKCTSCVHLYPENIYYGLNSKSLCIKCPSICEGCFWKESISNFGCKSCHIGYILKDDQCLSCPNIPQLGTGCEDCSMINPWINLNVTVVLAEIIAMLQTLMNVFQILIKPILNYMGVLELYIIHPLINMNVINAVKNLFQY